MLEEYKRLLEDELESLKAIIDVRLLMSVSSPRFLFEPLGHQLYDPFILVIMLMKTVAPIDGMD